MNSPDYAALRNARDFLSRLLDLLPTEALDALSNNGEDVLASFNAALGEHAFGVGDQVIASPEGFNEFLGTVTKIRTDADGKMLFSVLDQDDDTFDCELSELIPA